MSKNNLCVSLVQSNIIWQDKIANLRHLETLFSDIPKNTHLVVLPEMFSTGFSMNTHELAEEMNGDTLRWMRDMSIKYKFILTGSVMIQENDQFFNRMIWMMPDGKYSFYDKRHLFAYAGEDMHYTAGNRRIIVSVNNWKFLLLICYDLRFPVWSRQQPSQKQAEYDGIIYVANWPASRSHAWKSLLVGRAIENQAFVIGVNRIGNDGNNHNYSGDTMLVDPFGKTECIASEKEIVQHFILTKETLDSCRNQFPFLSDADPFLIINESGN